MLVKITCEDGMAGCGRSVVSSVELIEYIKLGLLDGVALKPARTACLCDGEIEVPRGPGLGVEVDESRIRK